MVLAYHVGTHFKALKKVFVMKVAFFFEFTEAGIQLQWKGYVPKTDILNFGKFLLVLLGTLDDQPTLKTHLYKLLIFLQWLNFFTSTPWKIVRPELFQPPNISTQKSARTKYFELFYFNLLENISNFFFGSEFPNFR